MTNIKIASDHGFPKDGSDALDAFKNERDYIAQAGRLKTTVAAMDWAYAEIERLRSERERCAAIADRIASETGDGEGEFYIARKIADAIRASGGRP